MKRKTKKPLPPPELGDRLNMTAWRRHYVSSVPVTDDDAWLQREPGSNLGRIFVLLLLLHVFIIGAVVLYNIVSPKAPLAMRIDPKPQTVNKPATATPTKTETTVSAVKVVSPPPVKTIATVVTPPPPAPAKVPTPAPVKLDTPTPAANAADDVQTYEVKSGDNVPGIAAELGVSAEDLVKMNSLDTTDLYPGRKLEYRKPSDTPPAPVIVVTPPATKPSHSANLVTNTQSKPKADTMKASEKPKADDTPKAKTQASTSNTSSDSPPRAIPVKSNFQVEDQPPAAKPMKHSSSDSPPTSSKPKSETKSDEAKPKKSKTDKSESSSKTASKSSKEGSGKHSHVVGSHETLYSIAKKFGVSVSSLQKANGIKDPTQLRDGQRLVIPSKN